MQADTRPKPYVIVVGVDYSETGALAVQRAFELAADQPLAEVHMVNVCRSYGPMVYVDLPQTIRTVTLDEAAEQLKSYADRMVREFREARGERGAGGFQRAVTHLRIEVPATEIAQLASDLDADLVVVGTHGRRGLTRVLLGSVAEAVVRLAPCPVLIVRPKRPEAQLPSIQPPCPACMEARRQSGGSELWCETHRQRHGRRHTYHYADRNVESRPPAALLTELR